jgi:hypothetical protein
MPREDVWASGDAYLTAVELVKLGLIVSPTSRSAIGADLLVTNEQALQQDLVGTGQNIALTKFNQHAPIV